MNNIRRISAIIIAILLLVAAAVPAMALQTVNIGGGTGSLTISNATKGEKYTLYKIFDATVSADGKNIVYKLPADKTLAAPATNWFNVSANGEITAKDDFTANNLKETGFKTWAEGFGVKVADQTVATDNSIAYTNLPFGYYFLESSLGAVVSVDSVNPDVTVIDKNQKPSWDNGNDKPGKVIIETKCGKDDDSTHTHNNDCYSKVQVNEANLDEAVNFDIGVNAKNYNGEHKIYHYIIDDTIAPGMSYIIDDNHPMVVKVGNTEIQSYSADNPNGYKITYYSTGLNEQGKRVEAESVKVNSFNAATVQSFRIEIPWTDLTKLNATAEPPVTAKNAPHLYDNAVEIHVNYYGKLDSEKASNVQYVNANLNKSVFNWFQDSDTTGPGGADPDHNQPERKTETYITSLELFKYVKNGQTKTALQGAEFTLTRTGEKFPIYVAGTRYVEDANGTYWRLNDGTYTTTDPATEGIDKTLYESETTKYKLESFTEIEKEDSTAQTTVKAFVDAEGKIIFKGLAEGTYTVSETVVPAGYNKAEDITFTVTFNSTTKKFESDNANVTMGQHFTVEVENKTGKELPSTGGIGTTIFTVVGATLLIGAAVVLVARRKAGSKR